MVYLAFCLLLCSMLLSRQSLCMATYLMRSAADYLYRYYQRRKVLAATMHTELVVWPSGEFGP